MSAASVDVEPSICALTLAQVLERNWALRVHCLNPRCRVLRDLPMVEIATRFRRGLGATVEAFGARLRCQACGGRSLRVYNVQGGAFRYVAHEGEAGRARAFRAWLAEVDRAMGGRT